MKLPPEAIDFINNTHDDWVRETLHNPNTLEGEIYKEYCEVMEKFDDFLATADADTGSELKN